MQEQQMQEQAMAQPMEQPQVEQLEAPEPVEGQEPQDDVSLVMQKYGVDENTAQFMLDATAQGFTEQEIADAIQRNMGGVNAV
jgi:NACalpha-BTF3-like transcription factor